MRIIIDTSIWSLAFRRKVNDSDYSKNVYVLKELKELINETRAIIIGPIRQEILLGISNSAQYKKLKEKLRAFKDFPISTTDYELAADYFNLCRGKGIQGSHIDFLICAVASRNDMSIYTTDRDFDNYSKVLKLRLHRSRSF
jgi:predicted nucleic acid-binding protein